MWRIDGATPAPLAASPLPAEKDLQKFLENDPSLLGERLLIIGSEVSTLYDKRIDLLALDGEGNLHVLELKRDKTPRDVVAQVLDYGAWATTLLRDDIIEIAGRHLDEPFEVAFEKIFGSSPPDELNSDIFLTIVAGELDSSTERIVTYLRDFGVPINAVFFSYLEDEGRRYLARSWFAAADEESPQTSSTRKSKRASWNGRDWYVSFGDGAERAWADGKRYGFISAGGGEWYSRSLKNLPVGARVNVYVPGRGYVAVGETLANATRFNASSVLVNDEWVPLPEQQLHGTYRNAGPDEPETDEVAEYVVPVRWIKANDLDQAYKFPGLFANQLSACKLRQEFTLERLAHHFGLGTDD